MDSEFKLTRRPDSYLCGRRDAFEVAAVIVNDARGESCDLRSIRDELRTYANAAIAEINRRMDEQLAKDDSATRALSFDEMLNKIAPYLEGTHDAHARAEKIIRALFGEQADGQ